MFVRWKKRKSHDEKRSSLSAYLVQSVRIDGKPRQKVLAFLGTLSCEEIEREHAGWWCSVEERLHGLHLDEETIEQVLQVLVQKTPRPSPEKMREAHASRAALGPTVSSTRRSASKTAPVGKFRHDTRGGAPAVHHMESGRPVEDPWQGCQVFCLSGKTSSC